MILPQRGSVLADTRENCQILSTNLREISWVEGEVAQNSSESEFFFFCLDPQFSLCATSLNDFLQRSWKLVTPSDFTGID